MGTFTLTQTPDSKFAYLYPNANGCNISCFPFGDNPNWECVDDIVDSLNPDSTYVYMDGDSVVSDTYDVDDHGTLTGTINYVKGCCRAKSDSHPPAHDYVYKIILSRDDDCDEFAQSPNMPLSTGFTTFEYAWSENPFTSAAWAWGDLDDLQVGFEASSPSVVIDPVVLLPVYNGDTTDITGVTSGYEHWEAVCAERPLTEVYETGDTWKYDLYEYAMADSSYYTTSCYSIIKIDDYILTTDAVNNKTYIYAWENGRVRYLTQVASGGYRIVGSGNNIYYVGKLSDIIVLTYDASTNTLSVTQTKNVGDETQDILIRDSYLFSASHTEGLMVYSIDSVDGTLDLVDSDDSFTCDSISQDDNYIYASGNGKLKAFTFESDTLTEVGTINVSNVAYGLATDGNQNVFIPVGVDGLKAYSFDGTNFNLEDTIDDGGSYSRISYLNSVVHVGNVTSAALRAYSYIGGSFSLLDTLTDVSNPCRGITTDNYFLFTGGSDGSGLIVTFNGTLYKKLHDVSNGMLSKYLDDNIASVSIVAKMGKEYDAPDEAEIYGCFCISDITYTSSSWQLDYPKKWYAYTWTTNPVTGNPWTLDEVKSLQAGIGLKGDGSKFAACSICQLVISATSNISPEIQTSQCYLKVNYSPPESSCTLHKPSEISFDHRRNIEILNFWSGNREVYDESRASKTLVLTGTEYEFDPEFYTASYSTVTDGYFDDYDVAEAWTSNPSWMSNGNPAQGAFECTTGSVHHLTSNNVSIPSNAIVSKVEIRCCWERTQHYAPFTIYLRPIFNAGDGDNHSFTKSTPRNEWGYTDWVDVTTDTNAPATWTPSDVEDLECDVEDFAGTNCGSSWMVGVSIVEIRVTYTVPEVFSSTPCERIQCIRNMGENGATVSPSGLGWGTGFIDGNYRIKSFGWNHVSEKPEVYDWVLELEASE